MVLIATGDAPVGGRVVAASPAGETIEVVLALVRPEEMFSRVDIDEVIDLDFSYLEIPQFLIDAYEITVPPDGSLEFVPRATDVSLRETGHLQVSLRSQTVYPLGPFQCETSSSRLPISLAQPFSFNLDTNLSVSLRVRDRFEHLILSGQPRATFRLTAILSADLSGSVGCKLEVVKLTVPVGGWLAVLYGAQVPMGIGMELDGKVTLAREGFDLSGEVGADFRIGVECPSPGACSMVNELDPKATGGLKWLVPDPERQFRIEPSFFSYTYAGLELGSRLTNRFKFSALELKAGMSQEANLAPVSVQVADGSYASDYVLKLKGEAAALKGLDDWLELLSLQTLKLKAEVSQVLHQSPAGTAIANIAHFEAGDPVSFEITLDTRRLYYAVVGYNVDEVRIYRRTENGTERLAAAVAEIGAESVTLDWIADGSGDIGGNMFAFIVTRALPFLPLELGPVSPGTGSSQADPTATSEPGPRQCESVLRPQISAADGTTIQYEHTDFQQGETLSADLIQTHRDRGVTFSQKVTATYQWDQMIETADGTKILVSGAWWVTQQAMTLGAGGLETTDVAPRWITSHQSLPIIRFVSGWTEPEQVSGKRTVENGLETTVVNYFGCRWW